MTSTLDSRFTCNLQRGQAPLPNLFYFDLLIRTGQQNLLIRTGQKNLLITTGQQNLLIVRKPVD